MEAATNNQKTVTITIWTIVHKNQNGVEEPTISFEEPWQNDMPEYYDCRKLQAEVPNQFFLWWDQTNGHQQIWDAESNDEFPVFPQVNPEMDTLTLTVLDQDGWNGGINKVYTYPLKQSQTK